MDCVRASICGPGRFLVIEESRAREKVAREGDAASLVHYNLKKAFKFWGPICLILTLSALFQNLEKQFSSHNRIGIVFYSHFHFIGYNST